MHQIVKSMTDILAAFLQTKTNIKYIPPNFRTELEKLYENFDILEVSDYFLSTVTNCLNQILQQSRLTAFTINIITRQGGQDAQDLSEKLFIMYKNFFLNNALPFSVIDIKYSETGIHQAVLLIKDPSITYLFLPETGIHRFERYSPYKKQKKVYTSSIEVKVFPIFSAHNINIDTKKLEIKPIKASGPGGQFVNKTLSGALLRYDDIIIRVTSSRSFNQNKNKAIELLKSRLIASQDQQIQAQTNQIAALYQTTQIVRTYDLVLDLIQYTPLKLKIKKANKVLQGDLLTILMYNIIYAARETCNKTI